MLLAVLGALAIGLSLGLLGSGGSILTVPVLHYLLHQPEQIAIAGSLLVVGLIATAACIPYAAAKLVDWRNALWFGVPGMAGAWVGASLARWVPGTLQLALFAIVMLLAAWRMLRPAALKEDAASPRPMAIVAGGAAVGALSGLVGIVGSMAGNRLGRKLPQEKLRRIFGLFLIAMGLFVAADAGPRLLH